MIRFAANLKVDILVLTLFVDSGKGNVNKNIFYEDNEIIMNYLLNNLGDTIKKYSDLKIQFDMRPSIVNFLKRKYELKNLTYSLASTDCLAGEKMWYITANGNLHPCNVMINQNIEDFPRELICVDEVNLKCIDDFKNLLKNQYFKSFIELKRKEKKNRKFICKNCELREICFPCFVKLYQSDEIPECKKVFEKEEEYFKTLLDCYPIIETKFICYHDLNGEIHVFNVKENVGIQLEEIDKKIFDLIIQEYNINEIIKELKEYDNKELFRVLLDYRLNGIICF